MLQLVTLGVQSRDVLLKNGGTPAFPQRVIEPGFGFTSGMNLVSGYTRMCITAIAKQDGPTGASGSMRLDRKLIMRHGCYTSFAVGKV